MTLRELAKGYTRDYDFRLKDEKGAELGKYERNEIVGLNYLVAECDVINFVEAERTTIEYAGSMVVNNLVYVTIERNF
jgi:hypothetical protein